MQVIQLLSSMGFASAPNVLVGEGSASAGGHSLKRFFLDSMLRLRSITTIENYYIPRFFEWAETFALKRLISMARGLDIQEIHGKTHRGRLDDLERYAGEYVRKLSAQTRIQPAELKLIRESSRDVPNFRFAKTTLPGKLEVFLDHMEGARVENRTLSNPQLSELARSVLAHEYTHIADTDEAVKRALRRYQSKFGLGRNEALQQIALDNTKYNEILREEISRMSRTKFLATSRTVRTLNAFRNPERNPSIVFELVRNSNAQTFTASQPCAGIDIYPGLPVPTEIATHDIPGQLKSPKSYAGQVVGFRPRAMLGRMGMAIAESRIAMGAFRGFQLGSSLFFIPDIITALNSSFDEHGDKIETSLQWSKATVGTLGNLTGLFAYLKKSARLAKIAARTISFAPLLIATHDTYAAIKRVRTGENIRGLELASSIGDIAAGGFIMAGTFAGNALIPFVGIAASLGLSYLKESATEDHIAEDVADIVFQMNKETDENKLSALEESLKKLCAETNDEFDDEVAVKLFEQYFIPWKFLSSNIWRNPRLEPLRKKLINELGKTGPFSYMTDEEAAYRFFVALHEPAEVEKVGSEMDNGDWKKFNKLNERYFKLPLGRGIKERIRQAQL